VTLDYDCGGGDGPLPSNNDMEMEKLVSLSKRRGFLFPSGDIYGGLNGFWDYGPLGVVDDCSAELEGRVRLSRL
jgi:hypothetical protein